MTSSTQSEKAVHDPARADAFHNCYFQAFEQHPPPVSPETPAIVEPVGAEGGGVHHRVVSYGRLFEEVGRLAGALARLGIGPGDRVLLMVPMSVELYESILAVMKLGAVALFIDPADGIANLNRSAESMSPKAFIGVPRAHVLRLLSRAVRKIPIQISTWPTFLGWTKPWAELLAGAQSSPPTAAVLPGDPAMISFTSGSSGTPKGVCRTHSDLRSIFRMLCGHDGKKLRGVDFCAFPILPLDDLSWGRTSLLPRAHPGNLAGARAEDLADQLVQFPPTLLTAPPGTLRLLVDRCLRTGQGLPTLKHVFTGGGVVPIPLVRDAAKVWPETELHILYGSTEAEPVSLIGAPEILAETAARTENGEGMCVGRIAPETKVVLVEPSEAPLDSIRPTSGIGEILVSGPHVNRAYFRDEAQTRRHKFHDPATGLFWHRMGDLGWQDEKGRLWLVGRLSNRVQTPQRTLYPVQVEPIFDSLPGVRKTALVGIPVVIAGIPQTVAALLVELEPPPPPVGQASEPALRPESNTLEEIRRIIRLRNLPIRAVHACEKVLVDRRIGAKVQYAALAELYGPTVRAELGDPLALRMVTYCQERFPVERHALVSIAFAAAIAAAAGRPATTWEVLIAAMAVLAFFWHLRVADEHQDFERDKVERPDRPVVRGVVTLPELARTGRFAFLAGAAAALCLGTGPLGWWALAALWSFGMRLDFFAPGVFVGRPILRGLTHAPLGYLLAQFLAAASGSATPILAPALAAALLAPLSGLWWSTRRRS